MPNSMPIKSYTSTAELDQMLTDLANLTGMNKSEIIRHAVADHIQKENPDMSATILSKAQSAVEKFFNAATELSDEQYLMVKNEASTMLSTYAAAKFPAETPGNALLKLAAYGEADDHAKALYKLASLRNTAEFSHYKAQIAAAEVAYG